VLSKFKQAFSIYNHAREVLYSSQSNRQCSKWSTVYTYINYTRRLLRTRNISPVNIHAHVARKSIIFRKSTFRRCLAVKSVTENGVKSPYLAVNIYGK